MRLALIGTGLIGGSAAWAMKQAGIFTAVTACDLSASALEKALEMGIADRTETSVTEVVADADAVMVAVPVLAMKSVFAEVARNAKTGTLITDVGSVRGRVIDDARQVLGTHFADYAPVHPIAGGEMPGVEYADASLFVKARAISTPVAGMKNEAVDFWETAWKAAGSDIYRMTPEEHDAIFADVSHLPHVLAYALVDAMEKSSQAEEKFSFVGGGFRDFTRIAASSPAMWRDICLANRDALLASITRFEAELSEIKRAVAEGDAEAMTTVFTRASNRRRTVKVPVKQKP